LFDLNRSELKPGGMNNINKLADFLRESPDCQVIIEGYTDSTGAADYNQSLSERRANSVRVALVKMGVSPQRVVTQGYGKEYPVASNSLAATGVRFSNTWSMPTCSTTRVALFSGRYPPRTNVNTAIVSTDYANSQMSPFERSLPRVLGFDYFAGYFDGGPRPINVTAGLNNRDSSAAPYTCGFVSLASDHPQGADTGACYQVTGSCEDLSTANASVLGKLCLERGGLFDPGQQCAAQVPDYLDFTRQNAYYTAEVVISDANSSQRLDVDNPASRLYRTQLESNFAIDWIDAQSDDQPRCNPHPPAWRPIRAHWIPASGCC
jgi:hypothetical protein